MICLVLQTARGAATERAKRNKQQGAPYDMSFVHVHVHVSIPCHMHVTLFSLTLKRQTTWGWFADVWVRL
jgi:hypothetical protein